MLHARHGKRYTSKKGEMHSGIKGGIPHCASCRIDHGAASRSSQLGSGHAGEDALASVLHILQGDRSIIPRSARRPPFSRTDSSSARHRPSSRLLVDFRRTIALLTLMSPSLRTYCLSPWPSTDHAAITPARRLVQAFPARSQPMEMSVTVTGTPWITSKRRAISKASSN